MSSTVPEWGRELFVHPIAKATMEALREKGLEGTDVAEICARAGVDPAELPEAMREMRHLLIAVSEAYAEDFQAEVEAAFEGESTWPANLRAAAYEVVRWIDVHPEATWWGTVGLLETGEAARARRDEIFAWAAAMIDAGRAGAPDPAAVPEQASTMAIGAIVETLGRNMQGGIEGDPVDGVRWLMYAAVRPYLGEDAARAELEIPPPADLRRGKGPGAPPGSAF